ncbi:MAG: peptidylprolyl isomerase [Micrococcales bacterium]|nr:peptidylprolyl isomerase [Micrococcales bacterium]
MPTRNEREARAARERLRVYEARQAVHRTQRVRRRRDNIVAGAAAVLLIAGASTAQSLYFSTGPGAPSASPSASAGPSASPGPSAAAGKNVGDIPAPATAEGRAWTGTLTINDIALGYTLDGAKAPQATAVWLQTVKQGYFDGKACHRVVTGASAELIQCGSADGAGGSDPTFSFGPIENAPADGVYPAGTLAMARSGGNAYSQGRQFFITTTATTLPADAAGGYTVFGSITTNLDRLRSEIIAKGTSNGSTDGPPAVSTTIRSVTVS